MDIVPSPVPPEVQVVGELCDVFLDLQDVIESLPVRPSEAEALARQTDRLADELRAVSALLRGIKPAQ